MSIQDFEFTTQQGHRLSLSLYGGENLSKGPLVIYAHGFKGFKDWGFVPYAANYFAQQGYAFLTFNFSHNGIGADPQNLTELDRFSQNTFLLEVGELEEVIKQAAHTNFLGADLGGRLGLIGHSRGGGVSIIAGRNRPEVHAITTWASVISFDRYDKATRQAWRKRGYEEVVNSRTGQVYQLGMPILNEIEKYAKTKLNVLQAAREFERPLLIVHGQADETVPYFEAEQLNIYASPDHTGLRLIPKAGHTFGAAHPFLGSNPALDLVLESTLDFFNRHLMT